MISTCQWDVAMRRGIGRSPRPTVLLRLLAILGTLLLSWSPGWDAPVAHAQAPLVGLPSLATTDGKFLGIGGEGLQTLTSSSRFTIGVSGSETSLSIGIFDGDLGGKWDLHDPLNSVQTEFLLYADPTRSGDPAGKTLVAMKTSSQLVDDDWADLYRGPVHPSAKSFTGNYFYLLQVRWSDASRSANEFNAFKIRAEGQLGILPGEWAFVGGPINLLSDPAFGTAGNSYNGSWDWFVYVPPGSNRVNFTDCDADARLGDPGGNPPDDELSDPRVRIPPDVRHAVFAPDGSLVINTLIPSGNSVCKTVSADAKGSGIYRWNWIGVDAHNLIFIRLEYETYNQVVSPLQAGTPSPTPSATGTPTSTPTNTPTPLPSGTPSNTPVATNTPTKTNTPVPTSTPPPAAGAAGPTNTPRPPAPILTAQVTPPTNTPTSTRAAPTNTPVPPTNTPLRPTDTPRPPAVQVPTPGVQLPRTLPRTGDIPLALVGVGLPVLIGLAWRVRRRSR